MSVNYRKVSLVIGLFFISSIKYILFGTGKVFNTVSFHHAQFASFNNYLSVDKQSDSIETGAKISLLAFFGLFPYDTGKNDIHRESEHGFIPLEKTRDFFVQTLSNVTNPDAESSTDLDKAMFWVDDNKFLVSVIIMFMILVSSFLIKVLIGYYCCKKRGNISNCNSQKWTSYYNFFLRIMLIAYCNVATITIGELSQLSDNLAFDFVVICVLIIFVIGFPIYIMIVMSNNKNKLDDGVIKKKYGPLFEQFKGDDKNSRFMILIILKQLLYSIIINQTQIFNIAQNSMLTLLNIIFLGIMIYHNPYREKLDQVESIIMSSITTFMVFVNYALILDEYVTEYIQEICSGINFFMQLLTILITIIVCIISFIINRKNKNKNNNENHINDDIMLDISEMKSNNIKIEIPCEDANDIDPCKPIEIINKSDDINIDIEIDDEIHDEFDSDEFNNDECVPYISIEPVIPFVPFHPKLKVTTTQPEKQKKKTNINPVYGLQAMMRRNSLDNYNPSLSPIHEEKPNVNKATNNEITEHKKERANVFRIPKRHVNKKLKSEKRAKIHVNKKPKSEKRTKRHVNKKQKSEKKTKSWSEWWFSI